MIMEENNFLSRLQEALDKGETNEETSQFKKRVEETLERAEKLSGNNKNLEESINKRLKSAGERKFNGDKEELEKLNKEVSNVMNGFQAESIQMSEYTSITELFTYLKKQKSDMELKIFEMEENISKLQDIYDRLTGDFSKKYGMTPQEYYNMYINVK